jgi:hypothetical protein
MDLNGFVRSVATRDGGRPHMQFFVGDGGTGWIFFGVDASTGSWRELVATLGESSWSGFKPAEFGRAIMRYRLEPVAFTFAVDGVTETRTVRTIISEHYDHDSIPGSAAMERSYFGKGYGLLRWEAWAVPSSRRSSTWLSATSGWPAATRRARAGISTTSGPTPTSCRASRRPCR